MIQLDLPFRRFSTHRRRALGRLQLPRFIPVSHALVANHFSRQGLIVQHLFPFIPGLPKILTPI